MITPKAGSQSIINLYRKACARVQFYSKDFILENTDDFYIVGVTRNPFDRLASCWMDKTVNKSQHRTWSLYELTPGQSFEQFVKRIVQIPHKDADKHFRLMSYDLYSEGVQIPDYIVKVENMAVDWERARAEIWDRAGVLLDPMIHLHKSNKKNYQDYYTPELIKIVGDYYHDDLVNFGYTYEP